MDLNIVKKENDYILNTEIVIKTEPLDYSSDFPTDTFNFPGTDKQYVKKEIIELNIKSEDINIKDEVFCDQLEEGEQLGDLENVLDHSSSGDVKIEEKEDCLLEIAEEKLHESEENGESNRQNQLSVKRRSIQGELICSKCGKSFKHSSSLSRHLHIHSGVKRFKCDICEKQLTRNSNLKLHMLIHTDDKPHKCDYCNKLFKQKSALVNHKMIHGGKSYSCDQCDKLFSRNYELTRHKRIHSGEVPYKCDVCGKAFKQISHLILHRRIHTGEKPFSCDVCRVSFSDSSQLRRHKLRIHIN